MAKPARSSEGEWRRFRFSAADLAEQLEEFAARWPGAYADPSCRGFLAPDGAGRLVLPVLAPVPGPDEGVGAYAERLHYDPGRHVVLLARAAGVALGYWDREELLAHKTIRKYVVRGRGRAQPTHLARKGKSRYGSRLRLQNWQRLLGETDERLRDWWERLGEPERICVSAPARVFAALREAEPGLPFAKGDPRVRRIPWHVHRPDHAELLRVRRLLDVGTLELIC